MNDTIFSPQAVAAGAAQFFDIELQRFGPTQDWQSAEEQEERQQHAADPVDAGEGIVGRSLPGGSFKIAAAPGHPDAGLVVDP